MAFDAAAPGALRGAGQEELRPKSGREDILLYFFQSGYICRLVERRKRKNKKKGKRKRIFFFLLFSNTESARLFSPHCYVRLLPTLRVYTLLRLGGGEAGLGNSQSPAHFFFPFFLLLLLFTSPKIHPLSSSLCARLGNFSTEKLSDTHAHSI